MISKMIAANVVINIYMTVEWSSFSLFLSPLFSSLPLSSLLPLRDFVTPSVTKQLENDENFVFVCPLFNHVLIIKNLSREYRKKMISNYIWSI